MPSRELVEAVAVTAELCGRVFSEGAARVFVEDLSGYPEDQVMGALRRCRKEVRGVLTVQDVVSRLDDGRPGPDEAWAMVPHDERQSVVWTDEIAQASALVAPMIESRDRMGAQRAFREAYIRLVSEAREKRKTVNWWASLGHDQAGREAVVMQAVGDGRLTLDRAADLIPLPAPAAKLLETSRHRERLSADPRFSAVAAGLAEGPRDVGQIRDHLKAVIDKMRAG
jgi:hypothetical protein